MSDESPFERERAPLSRRLDAVIDDLATGGWAAGLVTVRSRWNWHDQLLERGIGAHSLRTTRYTSLPIAANRLAKVIRHELPTVIHAFGPFCALISGLSRYMAPGPVRIYDRSHVSGGLRLNLGSRVAGLLNDRTMARSLAVRDAALGLDKTSPSKIVVAMDGAVEPREVHADEATALRSALGVSSDEHVVTIVARLRPEKGHQTLIEAMRLLAADQDPRLHLLVVGAGPFEEAIHEALRAEEPFVAHLEGHQADIAPYLAISDVVAVPSYQDASPKVAAEAMASGRAVVASAVGGLREQIVDGVTGLLVPPRDPQALAQALKRVLADAHLAARLGEAGRRRYQSHFTLEQRTTRWMRCYDESMTITISRRTQR